MLARDDHSLNRTGHCKTATKTIYTNDFNFDF